MIKPAIPLNEKERLQALKSYEILDTETENIFDAVTKLAASICDVPISLISLIDENRQWFKSRHGLSATETSRDLSFCGHAINQDEIFYVEDATKDDRFKENPLVTGNPNVVFYAGKPLTDKQGFTIGTLCVIDTKPRKLSALQLEQLKLLGEQAIHLIQSRIELKKKDEAYSLLTKLSDNLPGFIYTFQIFSDGRSCFPYSSHFIQEVYELTSEEVRSDASIAFSRVHPEDVVNVIKTINFSARTMTRWSCDFRTVLPTRGERWLRGSANPEKAADGSILWHGYMSDITELKNQEDVINYSSKMATLGEMASGIAHEINNPLAIIKTASQLITASIERHDFNEEKLVRNMDKINQTTDRISKIIKGLKFFSGTIQDDQFKNELIFNIIEDTISLCSEKFKINNIDLILKFSPNINSILVECRAVDISQVLLNLLNNAYDAIELFDKKWVEVEIKNHNDSIIITVMDCGNGIKKEDLSKILTPFYTTKKAGKGTGLGLSISQRIVESHKGKMRVDHECKNTKFIIEIPKIHASPAVARQVPNVS
jgi:signal transduction histidine kinase